MNIYAPLLGICRGVEADILNYFSHRPHFATAGQISRATRRSRKEVGKCLALFDAQGILVRAHPTSHAFALHENSPIGRIITQFAKMPKRLAEDVAARALTWEPRPISIVLVGDELAELMGTENLLLVIQDYGAQVEEYKVHWMRNHLNKEYRLSLDVRIGTPIEISRIFEERGIDINFPPRSPATLGNHVAMGASLKDALKDSAPSSAQAYQPLRFIGGTGGI